MDNALYGVPKAVETLVLIYNKDLIDKPLNSLQDWYDFSKQQRAKTSTACSPSSTRFTTAGAISPMGGYIFGHNDKGGYNASDVGLNKPGAVEAVTYLKNSTPTGSSRPG